MRAHLKERLLILIFFLLYPSNSGTCYCLSSSHHQTMIQCIPPAALLLSLPFLNLSLSLVSSHFWQKCALLSFTVWRRNAQNPFWLPSFLSCVFNSCHEKSFWILPHWPHSLLSPVWFLPWSVSFQIQWSTPSTWIQIFLFHLYSPSTFIPLSCF